MAVLAVCGGSGEVFAPKLLPAGVTTRFGSGLWAYDGRSGWVMRAEPPRRGSGGGVWPGFLPAVPAPRRVARWETARSLRTYQAPTAARSPRRSATPTSWGSPRLLPKEAGGHLATPARPRSTQACANTLVVTRRFRPAQPPRAAARL